MLETFLNIAQELQLKGLSGENRWGMEGLVDCTKVREDTDESTVPFAVKQKENPPIPKENYSPLPQLCYEDQVSVQVISAPKIEVPEDMKELDEQIELVIGRSENIISNGGTKMTKAYVCQICGKEGRKTTIKDHIEVNHVEGISLPCKLCGKIFGSRHSLRTHNSRPHTIRNAKPF